MVGSPSWNRTLTDRQRVLLHTQPLMLMRYHWLSRDDDGQRYDPLCLWIKLFEVVIDQSGFGNDVVRDSVARELMPLLRAVDAANQVAPDEARHRHLQLLVDHGCFVVSGQGNTELYRPTLRYQIQVKELAATKLYLHVQSLMSDAHGDPARSAFTGGPDA